MTHFSQQKLKTIYKDKMLLNEIKGADHFFLVNFSGQNFVLGAYRVGQAIGPLWDFCAPISTIVEL